MTNKNKELEALIQKTGRDLFHSGSSENQSLFNKSWWQGKALSWTMKNPSFKTQLFRFIDVLPTLKTPRQILSHLNEYFKEEETALLLSGVKLGKLAPALTAKIITRQVSEMAKIFITGRTPAEALKTIEHLRKNHLAFTIDFLEEATLSEKEGLECQKKYLRLIDHLVQAREKWPQNKLLDKDNLGPIPPINISVKVTSLCSQIYPEAWKQTKELIKNRLNPLFKKAVKNFVFINLDIEQYQYKTLVLEVFKELLLQPEFKNYPHFGIVIQAYLKESFSDLTDLVDFSKQRGCPITIRLVKGAYWDSEVLNARQKNWPIPVWTDKADTDLNFEKCAHFLLKNHSHIKTAIGSHNIRSVTTALALHKRYPKACLEFQALYGMGDLLAGPLRDKGYCFRLYTTVGELIPGMSYLVRRLLENTANQSFIQASLLKNQAVNKMLSPPRKKENQKNPFSSQNTFQNYPPLDFTKKTHRNPFAEALAEWRKKLPLTASSLINGKEETSTTLWKKENPSDTNEIIGQVYMSSVEQAKRAVQTGVNFFQKGPLDSAEKRVRLLRKLADLIAEQKFLFAALEVLEVGKSWDEAQMDVNEAIDFCNYYAQSFARLSQPHETCQTSGESNVSVYEPVGVTAIIAPWNFPLAILVGMTVAPLVCGNPVIIKPAEQSSLIAFQFAKLLLKSGFPQESFAFLPGKGEEIGSYLVKHPDVSLLSFTGSFEVGVQMIKEAGQITSHQKNIKKCVVEMGGKNAIIVDESADLDEAILGIIHSAFSFQGQKCSACSRVLILEGVYERFMERFIPAVESLPIGSAENPVSMIGPVVDQFAFKKIQSFIQKSRQKARLLYQGKSPKGGHFIAPTVFLVENADHPLMLEEVFGPVLALFKVKNLEEAFSQANAVKYGLTAGFYSRHPGHIELFKSRMEAGNIYINRNCTGALVERHPFGGRKMSGLGSKAGGPEYLKQFLHTKIISENTTRRGFSPEIFSEDFLNETQ
ncbi:MAG: proline dehydrogenase family protein [Bdellovibrionales bacterium]|nr:proline dehydrogenase family protein [Bdellovibrionales bacterium]